MQNTRSPTNLNNSNTHNKILVLKNNIKNKKMKSILLSLTLIIAFTLTSCNLTKQTYEFSHVGTHSVKTDSDFKYIARNVLGKAKTTIKLSKWRKLKQEMATDGLLAEAKSKLPVLNDNQIYANMSIDILTTQVGESVGKNIDIKEITVEVVVSTDIIEYY